MTARLALRCVTAGLVRSVLPLAMFSLLGTAPDAQGGWTWNEEAKLTASDVRYGNRFGYSVSVSGDTSLIPPYS